MSPNVTQTETFNTLTKTLTQLPPHQTLTYKPRTQYETLGCDSNQITTEIPIFTSPHLAQATNNLTHTNVYAIISHAGRKLAYGNYHHDTEIIFLPETTFHVIGETTKNGVNIIFIQEQHTNMERASLPELQQQVQHEIRKTLTNPEPICYPNKYIHKQF